MEINEKNIKLLSSIGPRASFGLSAIDLLKKHEDLMILTCDVSTSAGLDRFRKQFPKNYIDLGIAEQNLIGVATGLASEKFKVVTTTFAPFQVIRCCEQIKVNLGYMKEKITMVGLASGLVLGNLGFTHCCIEDIGILRSIPNIKILSPSDSLETIKAIEASVEDESSCYIRLTGGTNNPIINTKDYKFEIGKSILMKEGKDLLIVAAGAILSECLKVSEILNKENISSTVINMHTIKPIDEKMIRDHINQKKLVVTVEEHNIIGGLGSAVSEVMSKLNNSPPLLFLGVNDNYSKSGSYKFLKEINGLVPEKIIRSIKNRLNE
jgi:transketolase